MIDAVNVSCLEPHGKYIKDYESIVDAAKQQDATGHETRVAV